jgi:hypothetical protein
MADKVSSEQFVKTWVKVAGMGGHVGDVAERLGVEVNTVRARSWNYLKLGIRLPKLERKPRAGLDVEALNKLIKEGK